MRSDCAAIDAQQLRIDIVSIVHRYHVDRASMLQRLRIDFA
jgi:hypothetical protein